MTERTAGRDPILATWLALSVALNVIGMASLAEGTVVWVDFIRQIITVYREVIQEPLRWATELVWPSGWPRIPPAVFDVFVVWSCLFLSMNIALYRATGTTVLSAALGHVRGVRSFFVFVLISALMFITLPFGTLRHLLTPNEYRYNALFPARRETTFSVLYSLLFVIGLFVLVLFVNYQFKRLGIHSV